MWCAEEWWWCGCQLTKLDDSKRKIKKMAEFSTSLFPFVLLFASLWYQEGLCVSRGSTGGALLTNLNAKIMCVYSFEFLMATTWINSSTLETKLEAIVAGHQ